MSCVCFLQMDPCTRGHKGVPRTSTHWMGCPSSHPFVTVHSLNLYEPLLVNHPIEGTQRYPLDQSRAHALHNSSFHLCGLYIHGDTRKRGPSIIQAYRRGHLICSICGFFHYHVLYGHVAVPPSVLFHTHEHNDSWKLPRPFPRVGRFRDASRIHAIPAAPAVGIGRPLQHLDRDAHLVGGVIQEHRWLRVPMD